MDASANWSGHWEQAWYGRQPMEELTLRFVDGRVEGKGRDVIGRFTFAGRYEADQLQLIKQYLGAHQVLYRGQHDGEGTIVGAWQCGDASGPFVLRPELGAAEDVPMREIGPGE